MTFDEIVDDILDRLNLTSDSARTRIEREVNRYYRRVRTSIGLPELSREKGVSATTVVGSANVTFSAVQKVLHVYDDSSGRVRSLTEKTFAEMREVTPAEGTPTEWSHESSDDSTVTILLNTLIPATGPTELKADVISTRVDLASGDTPAFPEDFHDILIEGVLADEYRKREKTELANISKNEFETRLSDLRMWVAKSQYLDIRQGLKSEGNFRLFEYK